MAAHVLDDAGKQVRRRSCNLMPSNPSILLGSTPTTLDTLSTTKPSGSPKLMTTARDESSDTRSSKPSARRRETMGSTWPRRLARPSSAVRCHGHAYYLRYADDFLHRRHFHSKDFVSCHEGDVLPGGRGASLFFRPTRDGRAINACWSAHGEFSLLRRFGVRLRAKKFLQWQRPAPLHLGTAASRRRRLLRKPWQLLAPQTKFAPHRASPVRQLLLFP